MSPARANLASSSVPERLFPSLALLLLAACSPNPPGDAGLALHQEVVVRADGMPGERRLRVLEDARITPEARAAMWGGAKDPNAAPPLRRALLRLIGGQGRVLAERRLDCELGEIAEPALPQPGTEGVWAIGDDCSTGEGDFAGLITRFYRPGGDRIGFEAYRDAVGGRAAEFTLVSARRIRWHLAERGVAAIVHEVSSHPDYDDPRFRDLPAGATPPADLPWVIDYLTFRWDGEGSWIRTARTERNADWDESKPWPPDDAFPE
jgi:hypothetical protein